MKDEIDRAFPTAKKWTQVPNPYMERHPCPSCNELPTIVRRMNTSTLQYKCPNDHIIQYEVDGDTLLNGAVVE